VSSLHQGLPRVTPALSAKMPGMTASGAAEEKRFQQFQGQTGRDEYHKKMAKAGCIETREILRDERKKELLEFHGQGRKERKVFSPLPRAGNRKGGVETPESIDDFRQTCGEGPTSGQQIKTNLHKIGLKKANHMKLYILRWEDNDELCQIIMAPYNTVRELHEKIIKTLGMDKSRNPEPFRIMFKKTNIFINDETLQEVGIVHRDSIHIARARRRCLILSGSSDGTVKLWSARTFRCVQTFPHQSCVNSASLSPDGTLAITACTDGVVRVWSAESGEKVASLRGHVLSATSAAIGPSNIFAATASEDGTALLWKLSTGKVKHVLGGHSEAVTSIAISPERDLVATCSKDRMGLLWATETGKCVVKLVGHDDHVVSIAFSPDGSSVITGSNDRTARIWSTKSGGCRGVLGGHSAFLCQAQFTADGTMAFTATYAGTIRLWDALGRSGHAECLRVHRVRSAIIGAYVHERKLSIIAEEERRQSRAIGGMEIRVYCPDDDEPPIKLDGHTGSVTFAKMLMVT